MSPFLFISLGFILNMILVSDALLSVWKFKFEIFLLIKTASWEYLPPLRDSYQRQGDREEEKAGLKFPHCQPMRTPVIWRQPMTERILKWSTFNQYFWDLQLRKAGAVPARIISQFWIKTSPAARQLFFPFWCVRYANFR